MGCIGSIPSSTTSADGNTNSGPKLPSPTNARFRSSVGQPRPTEPPFIENIWRIYERDVVLGEGACGKVYSVTKRDNKHHYALKQVAMTEDGREQFIREVDVLTTLDHPNIIRLNRTWRDENNNYILTKLCRGGQLMERVESEQFLSEKFAAEIMSDIVSAIAHAHSMNIAHADLKPQNIVFDSGSNTPIIIDWGEAHVLNPREMIKDSGLTRVYAPPEAYRPRAAWEMKKSDMWSIGVMTYVLLTGCRPFDGKNNRELMENVFKQRLEFPPELPLSKDAKEFVSKCLKRNLTNRVSAADALRLPWLMRASTQSDQNILSLVFENMEAISSATKLQKFLLNMRIKQMTKQERAELKIIFEQIDADGNGVIDVDEFASHLQEVVPTLRPELAKGRAEMLIDSVSNRKTGDMNLGEFAKAHVAHEMFSKTGMNEMFQNLTGGANSGGELKVGHLEMMFADSFGRESTKRESKLLTQHFMQEFRGKEAVSQEEFVRKLRLGGNLKSQEEILVEEMFSSGSEDSRAD